jgi:hypothetical protein
MVFCSIEFLVFFLFVAAAYWTLPSRPARALASVVSAAYLGYVGWYCLSIAYKADGWHIDAFDAAWANLPFNGELFFVAAVVCFGAGMAWAFGPHRGRVWLLLAASFYFYASVTLWPTAFKRSMRLPGARHSSPSASPPTLASFATSNTPISFFHRLNTHCTVAVPRLPSHS